MRRRFLGLAGAALFSKLGLGYGESSILRRVTGRSAQTDGAAGTIRRLLPQHADQIHLSLLPDQGKEHFEISGFSGKILVAGSSQSAMLMGLHWYLKYVAGVCASWNGDSLNSLPSKLPAPPSTITQSASVPHRFALNDTNDGYTCPYWSWEEWEHQIDILAVHGINEVLVYLGAEAVYQQTFRRFQLTGEELRNWFPTPAHQPWWLLDNLSSWVGPSCPQHLIDNRLALARKVTDRLRELGMIPVLPGYFGMLPDGFAERNPNARIVPQGKWLGMKRPDWLDPTSALFADVAREYYNVQETLLGPSSMFKVDPLHEGGEGGDVDIAKAARAIDVQLQASHPGAIWAILGWQNNPRPDVLSGIANKDHALILNGQSDRFEYRDREEQWNGVPYAFGAIWNFGGHTTMGANMGVWNERFFHQLQRPGSKVSGIAVMPEASCNNPAAFEFFTEMAWLDSPPDLATWFAAWSGYRYGKKDPEAAEAWEILRTTAYDLKSGKWSEAHDSLFTAQPDLNAQSACSWSPKEPRYDLKAFSLALRPLLAVHPSRRNSTAYRYDLVDVARQTVANRSRAMLPEIQAAYSAGDIERFQDLSHQWLQHIEDLDRIAATEPSLLFGRWLARARTSAGNPREEAQFEFDASSLLLEWGPESSRDSGIHDYASREWNGLLKYYAQRWQAYFSTLAVALQKRESPHSIDWFQMDQEYAGRKKQYAEKPQGDAFAVINSICRRQESQEIPAPPGGTV